MTVGTICNHNVATVRGAASIRDAAKHMREAHVGDLVVTEERHGGMVPIGIVTDRDLVIEVIAESVDSEALTVADIMSTDLVTVNAENGIEFALREMQRKGVRRAPVVNSDGILIGILSMDDVLDYVARLVSRMAASLASEQRDESMRRP